MSSSPKVLADFDALFFISLPQAVDRRRSIEAQITKHQLRNAVIIDAVNGRGMDCEQARRDGIVVDGAQLTRPLHPGEIGCALSHRMVWQQIVDRGLESALILEDDAVLHDDCNSYMETILSQVPDTWDVIYLHSHFGVGSGQGGDHGRKKIGPNVYQAFHEGGGAAAYALSSTNNAAGYLIEKSSPVSYPTDGVTNWLSADWDRRHWKAYISWPFLVETKFDQSAIWSDCGVNANTGIRQWIWRQSGHR